jgi:hypothetical protein
VQLLLSQEYDDDWLDNPVVGGSWGLTWAFKEQWDDAMQVREGVRGAVAMQEKRAGRSGTTGLHLQLAAHSPVLVCWVV